MLELCSRWHSMSCLWSTRGSVSASHLTATILSLILCLGSARSHKASPQATHTLPLSHSPASVKAAEVSYSSVERPAASQDGLPSAAALTPVAAPNHVQRQQLKIHDHTSERLGKPRRLKSPDSDNPGNLVPYYAGQ